MKVTFGILQVTIPYTYKHGKSIYYQRGIPQDLQDRYGSKRIKVNLGTSDLRVAAKKVEALNRKVEAEWALLRGSPQTSPKLLRKHAEDLLERWGLVPAQSLQTDTLTATENQPEAVELFYDYLESKREAYAAGDEELYRELEGHEYLSPVEIKAAQLLAGTSTAVLSDALELYLSVHPKRGNETFKKYSERAFNTLIDAIGDKSIDDLSRQDAHRYVSSQAKGGAKTSTIRRRLNVAHAVMETWYREKDINRKNPFSRVPIPGEGGDTQKRESFTQDELKALIAACKARDDELRWIVAMLADTGARLGEIIGLTLDDIVIGDDVEVPHVVIQPHPWRSLKNADSERVVPLVGAALWAAKRIKKEAKKGQRFAFPKYTNSKGANSNSASAALGKWIRTVKVNDQTMNHTSHELRHTLADRLREVQCPEDIRFAIGGWATKAIGAKYGKGYSLRVMEEWLSKIVLPS